LPASAPVSGPQAAPIGAAAGASDQSQRAVDRLIDAYRSWGHFCATLDPFGRERQAPEELSPQHYGLSDADLDRVFDPGLLPIDKPATLRAIIDVLDETYCRSVGVEYMHIADAAQREWMRVAVESSRNRAALSDGE